MSSAVGGFMFKKIALLFINLCAFFQVAFCQTYTITLQPRGSTFFIGYPMVVKAQVHNGGQFATPFDMDDKGLPLGIVFYTKNADGREVPGYLTDSGLSGSPARRPDSEHYYLKSGQTVEINFDINEYFKLTSSGKYEIDARSSDGDIFSQVEVNVTSLKPLSTFHCSGICTLPPGSNRLITDFKLVHCDVIIGRCEPIEGDTWYVSIADLHLSLANGEMGQGRNIFPPIHVPQETTIEKALIDCKWQLWLLLKDGTKRSIIVWDMLNQDAFEVEGWTTDELSLGLTRTTPHVKTMIVFGGKKGSTYSTTSFPRGKLVSKN